MKAYLITTGSLFGLIAVAHVLRTVAEWRRLVADPGFILEGPVLGLAAGALGVWAWRLLRRPSRAGEQVGKI
jgi:hypothetical protein